MEAWRTRRQDGRACTVQR
jgi:hypothetical protein